MDSRTEERVTDWDSRPFSAGFEDLRDLADDEFSGAVEAGGATLFMLNGRVVGIFGGDMAGFEGASGTTYEAPHPSLPLLFAMREQGGDERAKYYTNDTPISEADGTLSSGTFTGYIELSENVLSGDYYVVYYGGRSMSCAFVGNSENLVTGDEAFDRADDEVGIYTVWDVDVEVTDIPEPESADDGGVAAGVGDSPDVALTDDASGAGTGSDDSLATGRETRADESTDVESAVGAAGTTESDDVDVDAGIDVPAVGDTADEDGREPAADDAVAEAPAEDDRRGHSTNGVEGTARDRESETVADVATNSDGTSVVEEAEPEPVGRDEQSTGRDTGSTERRDATSESGRVEDGPRGRGTRNDDAGERTSSDDANGGAMAEVPDEVMAEVEDEAKPSGLIEEEAWRETTTIPSISPERTTEEETTDPLASASAETEPGNDRGRSSQSTTNGGATREPDRTDDRGRTQTGNQPASQGGASGVDPARVDALEEDLEGVREERDAVVAERNDLETERDELRERNRELQVRVEELEGEVDALERELGSVREELAAVDSPAVDASVELEAREALAGTNLFVRYGSKSATTMEDVHDSDVGIADLESNLRLEYHTGFDATDAFVDGQPYEDFLYDSTPYRFVEWFVYDLVFEVRDTGNESGLSDLYEAFPKVDRIELFGDVSLRYDEDGEEHREQTTFDVVVRDRMGNPIAVANVNDGREPATEEMMVDLQERASRVKRTSDALAGAFMVTASYFEPGALETAGEATSGSLLRRDSRKSYVKLSRKSGYHLCLVETRNGEFHVNVPEL